MQNGVTYKRSYDMMRHARTLVYYSRYSIIIQSRHQRQHLLYLNGNSVCYESMPPVCHRSKMRSQGRLPILYKVKPDAPIRGYNSASCWEIFHYKLYLLNKRRSTSSIKITSDKEIRSIQQHRQSPIFLPISLLHYSVVSSSSVGTRSKKAVEENGRNGYLFFCRCLFIFSMKNW